jgi:outer membrane protein assembly factor BamB
MAVALVAKLDGASGAPLWTIETPNALARAVAVLPDGDVVTVEDGEVHRRRGSDGQRLWTWDIRRVLYPQRVDIDGSGDVIVTGQDYLLKVDGEAGSFHWYAPLPDFTAPLAGIVDVALDGRGDVVVAGAVAGSGVTDFAVLKFAGDDGTEAWRYVEERDGRGRAVAVAVDGRGDAVATGQLEGFPSGPFFEAVRLDGRTGRREWIVGPSEAGAGADVAVDRAGHAAVSGFLSIRRPPAEPDADLVVVRLSRSGRGLAGPLRRHGPRDPK